MNLNWQKIKLTVFSVFIIGWATLVAYSYYSIVKLQKDTELEFAHKKSINLEKLFELELTENTERLDAILAFIEKDETIVKAWKDQDREQLLKVVESQFSYLKLKHKVTHFYFHDKNTVNFLRVHKPEKFGDSISRVTMQRAVDSGETSHGIEFGTLGHFVLRVVKPWRHNGEIIGYIELGEEINEIIERLAVANNYDLYLAVDKNYLQSLSSEILPNLLSSVNNESLLFDDYIVSAQSMKNGYEISGTFVDNYATQNAIIEEDRGQSVLWAGSRIYDISGAESAVLFFSSQITDSIDFSNRSIQSYLWGSLVLGVLIGGYLFIYATRLQRKATRFLRLGKENQILVATKKELQNENQSLLDKLSKHEQSLSESQRRYHTLFEKTTDALLLIDGNKFIDCNQATLDMLGYNTKEELYDTHPSELSPEIQPDGQQSSEKANEMIAIAFQRGCHRFEWEHIRKNGEVFPVEVLLTAIPYGERNLLYTVWRDITERKKAERDIHFLAEYDALTELPNRRLLFRRLEEVRASTADEKNYHAVLFIDLDRFKNINDSMGHSIGDSLLINASKRIKSQLRDEDTLARFGGDEFVVLLKNLGTSIKYAGLYAERIAETIRQRFQIPIEVAQFDMQVTVSIGIALFPIEDESVEEVLRHSDMAMYRAKQSGRNQTIFFVSSMQEDVLRRLSIEKDLHEAIKRRDIAVYYQTQVNSKREIVGVEALARWNHPHYGFISPEEFIHIAEEIGVIVELGNLVMEKSVADILSIQEKLGVELNLSLNISPRQLSSSDFLPSLRALIRHYELNTRQITLEITESVMAENFAAIRTKLNELKLLGLHLSLDDFGTGYSSLSYLKQLPLDELKIDRSFVMELHQDPSNVNLVSTIINIGHQFNLSVVAEGVEVEEHIQFLQERDCDLYQGYYFCKPIPASELLELVKLELASEKVVIRNLK